jgi:DNA-binding NarL/FixJ family response regulator
MTGSVLRLLVVDDQAVVRLGFTALLDSQEDMSVAGDGQEAVRLQPAEPQPWQPGQ